MRRRLWLLLLPPGRRRELYARYGAALQDAEHDAAVRRLLTQATTALPTVPAAPLLTPGQADRSRHPVR